MSLIRNIDHLYATRGISAVVVTQAGERAERGDPKWTGILSAALELRELTDQNAIRITLEKHSVVIQREKDQVAAVLMLSGDPVAKSLKRMIRRMAARARPPLPEPTSSPAPEASAHPSRVDTRPNPPSAFLL